MGTVYRCFTVDVSLHFICKCYTPTHLLAPPQPAERQPGKKLSQSLPTGWSLFEGTGQLDTQMSAGRIGEACIPQDLTKPTTLPIQN